VRRRAMPPLPLKPPPFGPGTIVATNEVHRRLSGASRQPAEVIGVQTGNRPGMWVCHLRYLNPAHGRGGWVRADYLEEIHPLEALALQAED